MSAPDEGGALFQPELQYVAMGEALMWSIECKFGASFTPEPARPEIGSVLSHMVCKRSFVDPAVDFSAARIARKPYTEEELLRRFQRLQARMASLPIEIVLVSFQSNV